MATNGRVRKVRKLPPLSQRQGLVTPDIEQTAYLFLRGEKRKVRVALETHPQPALFALQVGLAIGVLENNPLSGYHRLRVFLSEEPAYRRGVK